MKQSFSRAERLLSPGQFYRVYQSKHRTHKAGIAIYFNPNSTKINRLGISIRNNICPNIVARNRCKRIVREIFRRNKSWFGRGNDIVVVVRKFPAEVTYKALYAQIIDEKYPRDHVRAA